MPAYEFNEWAGYFSVYPFDGAREDARHGILCSLLAAVNGDRNAKPQDFIPNFNATPDNGVARLRAFFEGLVAQQTK